MWRALLTASLVAGTVLAFGLQLALSAVPDLVWLGTASPSILSVQYWPSLEFWTLLALGGGVPAALLTWSILVSWPPSRRHSLRATAIGCWALAIPALGLFLGMALVQYGPPSAHAPFAWWVSVVVSALACSAVGATAHIVAIRVVGGRGYFSA